LDRRMFSLTTSLMPVPESYGGFWVTAWNQAADLASGTTSIPSWNLTPWMTFGNWF